MKNIGRASHVHERDTHARATFTLACLPPLCSTLFFRALYIFHVPVPQRLDEKKMSAWVFVLAERKLPAALLPFIIIIIIKLEYSTPCSLYIHILLQGRKGELRIV